MSFEPNFKVKVQTQCTLFKFEYWKGSELVSCKEVTLKKYLFLLVSVCVSLCFFCLDVLNNNIIFGSNHEALVQQYHLHFVFVYQDIMINYLCLWLKETWQQKCTNDDVLSTILTWYTGDAQHTWVTDVEAVQQVVGPRNIHDHHLCGGVSARTDPNTTGHLHMHRLLPFLLLSTHIEN